MPEHSNADFEVKLNIDTDDVSWFLDEDKLLHSPKDGVDIKKDGLTHRLSMSDVMPEDAGIVKLTARGKTTAGKLIVLAETPEILKPPKDQRVTEKETAEFVCELSKDIEKVKPF